MLGIMIIDMQKKFFECIDLEEKLYLLRNQKRLINFADERNIPILSLEYKRCGQMIESLKKRLENIENYQIPKYNDNGFIIAFKKNKKIYYNIESASIKSVYGGEYTENDKLNSILKNKGINHLIITGIFKDECVYHTVKGAVKRGYKIFTSEDLMDCKGWLYDWYKANSNHYKTLDKLFEGINNQNL
ncbi:cysteine hydrolase family protein [Candidatus Pacearchaeota archaeon]|nr:cysteine hydrolase family protein [Candidatus Pacearchaeota archaeon]